MAILKAYKIWSSDNKLGCGQAVVQCSANVVAASLVPHAITGTDQVFWSLDIRDGDTWNTTTGARNGVFVYANSETGIPFGTLWDVEGDASSDEDANSPYAKLAAWLAACCQDCDPDVSTLDGQYNGTYPALAATEFCYNVTITGVTEYPTAYALTQIAMAVSNDNLKTDVKLVSYNAGTDVLVVNLCLQKAVTSTGYPLGFQTSNPALGTGALTWTFAAV